VSDGCLLLLARADDPAVLTLREHAQHRLAHASVGDLACAGWQYVSGRPDQASVYAGGRVIRATDIAAVICRIAAITASDLPHVHRDDRAYVAPELNAFLRAWLTQFTGVRFNEPSWASLAGPGWHALQWQWLAARVGVPVIPSTHPTTDLARPLCETVTVVVVDGDVFGSTDPTLVARARRIARATHSDLLGVTFVHDGKWKFLSADACPDLDAASAAAVVRRAFSAAPATLGGRWWAIR